MTSEQAARDLVIAEAVSWLRTPFHPGACVKGAGVDCGTLLQAVYRDAGVPVPEKLGFFPADWFQHATEERYLNFIESYTRRIEGPPEPGDVAMFRDNKRVKVFSHGAIVIEWPRIIHAFWGRGVEWADASKGLIGSCEARFYSPWASSAQL